MTGDPMTNAPTAVVHKVDLVDLFTSVVRHIDLQGLVLILFLLIAARAFTRAVNGKRPDGTENPVEMWHFFSTRRTDGKEYGDPNKLAKMVFIFSSTPFVGYLLWAAEADPGPWVTMIFFGWAIAMLGIDVFAAWARSFVDRRFGHQDGAAAPRASGEPPKDKPAP